MKFLRNPFAPSLDGAIKLFNKTLEKLEKVAAHEQAQKDVKLEKAAMLITEAESHTANANRANSISSKLNYLFN